MTDGVTNLVEVRKVCKRYPKFQLGEISFDLAQGEVLGLVGANGAGKSTLLKLLLGFEVADSGDIVLLGKNLRRNEIFIKQRTSYVSEEMRLYGHKTLAWHMDFFAKAFAQWDQSYAQELLQRFQLHTNQKIKYFSLGQRIKANLLLAMARRPQLLVLDEPSTGLDPVARYELTSELFEIMLNEHNSVIFSSQFTQDVERLSDRIAFIDNGMLVSCQDKESYLDQWQRLEVSCPVILNFPGLHLLQSAGNESTYIDNQFHSGRLAELEGVGAVVRHVHKLSLEEIFIHQILLCRKTTHKEVA